MLELFSIENTALLQDKSETAQKSSHTTWRHYWTYYHQMSDTMAFVSPLHSTLERMNVTKMLLVSFMIYNAMDLLE